MRSQTGQPHGYYISRDVIRRDIPMNHFSPRMKCTTENVGLVGEETPDLTIGKTLIRPRISRMVKDFAVLLGCQVRRTLIICSISLCRMFTKKKEISESALPISPQSDVGGRPILVPYTLVLMYKFSFQKIIGSFMLGILCRLIALYLHALAPASSPALGVPFSRKICRKLL